MDAADVMVALDPTIDDRDELDALEAVWRAKGWHRTHFSDLLAHWADCARELQAGTYVWEEYLDYLQTRDVIEGTMTRASERLGPRLAAVLEPIDEAFRRCTVLDVARASVILRPKADSGWWWQRVNMT